MNRSIRVRPAWAADASCLAALAVHVFLDTYATEGVRPDLAREAFFEYSVDAFERRLSPGGGVDIDVAVDGKHVLGFATASRAPRVPTSGAATPGTELEMLYVQPRFHRSGIGRALLEAADRRAHDAGVPMLWLTAWEGNANALGFYARCGFADVGGTTHVVEGRAYGNRVLTRPVVPAEPLGDGA